ncbi:MAG: hypothetical protein GX606_01725 [Elusimicrobia bacterium]|nr:hypothetical protein [Elusimicrobiota bacterium]
MRIPRRLGSRIYAFFFAWLALSQMLGLLVPGTKQYVYYHVMIAFLRSTEKVYHAALASSVLTMIAVIPVFLFAFDARPKGLWLWRGLLIVRLFADLWGHNFEWQMIKSFAATEPLAAGLSLGSLLLLIGPSYYTHFRYAFGRK